MTKAENLSFLSIRIKNYRQFYDDTGKISLEPKNGKRINAIQGENGWGKSNILNAINYCLYLEEPHLKPESETMTFLNTKAIGEAKEGEQIEMIIELELGNEQRKYRIDRKITTTKGKLSEKIDSSSGESIVDVQRVQKLNAMLPVGVECDLMETSFTFADKGQDWQDRNFAAGVDSLLPDELRPFFFLDGEFLESLKEEHKIESYRITRCKLGFRSIQDLPEWHVMVETKDMSQLETAFQRVARAEQHPLDELESKLKTKHRSFNMHVADNIQHALYRDWPDE